MKININQIPLEGLILEEDISPAKIDLESEIIKFCGPVRVKAYVTKITNAVCVKADLQGLIYTGCSRCLKELEIDFRKSLKLNYVANKSVPLIDLDQDIREEIILDYPLKPLCDPNCKGLCPKCGKNLNEGNCNCVLK